MPADRSTSPFRTSDPEPARERARTIINGKAHLLPDLEPPETESAAETPGAILGLVMLWIAFLFGFAIGAIVL